MKKRKNHKKNVEIMEKKVKFMETIVIFMKRNVSPYLHKTAPHHMNRTELTPEPITVSSHPSIPLFPPPLPSSFPFLAGLVANELLELDGPLSGGVRVHIKKRAGSCFQGHLTDR